MADQVSRGFIQINALRLESTIDPRNNIDLSNLYTHMTIYENLYSPYVRGSISIIDANNIAETFPIAGFETLVVDIQRPGNDDYREMHSLRFRITSINDRKSEKQFAETYILDFVDEEYFSFITTRHSISLANNTIKNHLRRIYPFTSKNPSTPNDINIDDTTGNFTLTIPNLNTENTIRLLQHYAINENGINDYIFYGTIDGFQFRSLTSLYNARNPIIPLYQALDNLGHPFAYPDDPLIPEPPTNILPFITKNNKFNTLNRAQMTLEGAFSSRYYVFNPLLQNYQIYNHSLGNPVDIFPKIASTRHTDGVAPEDVIGQDAKAKIYVGMTNRGNHEVNNNYLPSYQDEKWMQSKDIVNTLLAQAWTARLTTTGNYNIRPGNMIYYVRKSANPSHKTPAEIYDRLLDGRYLVSAVSHSFVRGFAGSGSAIEIIKDSYD